MRAVVINAFGGDAVLQISEIEEPICGPNQVKIKVRACSVNPYDWIIRKGYVAQESDLPLVLGFDVAGEVVQVGDSVNDFAIGDAVFACMNTKFGGGYAEFVCLDEAVVALKPEALSFEEAAAIPCAGLTALTALENLGDLQEGQDVFINGASGGVGSFAVQIAKAKGANVVAVCSGGNAELVEELGADQVLNYKKQDIWKLSQQFDLVFDVVSCDNYFRARSIMKDDSLYVTTKPQFTKMMKFYIGLFGGNRRAVELYLKPSGDGLRYLATLAEAGALQVVIDSRFDFAAVRQAHQRSETCRARGKIVLNLVSDEAA